MLSTMPYFIFLLIFLIFISVTDGDNLENENLKEKINSMEEKIGELTKKLDSIESAKFK